MQLSNNYFISKEFVNEDLIERILQWKKLQRFQRKKFYDQCFKGKKYIHECLWREKKFYKGPLKKTKFYKAPSQEKKSVSKDCVTGPSLFDQSWTVSQGFTHHCLKMLNWFTEIVGCGLSVQLPVERTSLIKFLYFQT